MELSYNRVVSRLTSMTGINFFEAEVQTILVHAGVESAHLDELMRNPFVTEDNGLTPVETAKTLLMSRFPDDPNSTFPSILEALGLGHESVAELKRVAAPLVDYYGPFDAAAIAVEYAMGSYKPLKIIGPFPTDIKTFDKPFDSPDGTPHYYMTSKSQMTNDDIAKHAGITLSPSSRLWFHATSWSIAKNVVDARISIRHDMGGLNKDFGRGPGFYTGDNLALALNWAHVYRKLFGQQNAILVFRDVKAEAENAGLTLKLLTNPEEWRQVVYGSRQGHITLADNYDFVRGALLRNRDPASPAECNQSRQTQTAAKTIAAAKATRGTLLCTIYLSKENSGADLLKQYANAGLRA